MRILILTAAIGLSTTANAGLLSSIGNAVASAFGYGNCDLLEAAYMGAVSAHRHDAVDFYHCTNDNLEKGNDVTQSYDACREELEAMLASQDRVNDAHASLLKNDCVVPDYDSFSS